MVIKMEQEIDTDKLRKEVGQIKNAMGINDKKSKWDPQQWLNWGFLIAIASLISQIIVIYRMPETLISITWFGVLFGGRYVNSFLLNFLIKQDQNKSSIITLENKPNTSVIWITIFVGGWLILVNLLSIINWSASGYYESYSALTSCFFGLAGIAYILTGNSMKAFYIRAKDRYAFYIGGSLMILLSLIIPNIEFLQKWTYSVFAVFFLFFAIGSYLYLKEE